MRNVSRNFRGQNQLKIITSYYGKENKKYNNNDVSIIRPVLFICAACNNSLSLSLSLSLSPPLSLRSSVSQRCCCIKQRMLDLVFPNARACGRTSAAPALHPSPLFLPYLLLPYDDTHLLHPLSLFPNHPACPVPGVVST